MEPIVTCLSMVQKYTDLRQKTVKLQQVHYAQGTFNRSVDNMKKTGFNGYVYDFSVDYDATDVDDIIDIHKYLMKKIRECK